MCIRDRFAAAGFNFENLSTESRNWTSSTKTFAPEAESPHTAIVLRDMGEDVRIDVYKRQAPR